MIPNGLANMCSHRLVFSSNKRRLEFKQMFIDRFHPGVIAAGSTKSEFFSMIRCLRDGRPLFILRGSGIVSTAAETLINHFNDSTPNSVFDCFNHFIPIKAEIINQAESMLHIVESSGTRFDKDTYHIIDISEEVENIDNMKIIEVIGTVFDFFPEVGGEENDVQVLYEINSLLSKVRSTKMRYRTNALLFQILIRIMFTLSISISIIEAVYVKDKTEFMSYSYSIYELTALVTTSIGAILYGCDLLAKPNCTFSILLFTEALLQSEIYRFKTRTGDYRLLDEDGSTRDHRCHFLSNCRHIRDTCLDSGFAKLSWKQWPLGNLSSSITIEQEQQVAESDLEESSCGSSYCFPTHQLNFTSQNVYGDKCLSFCK